MVASRQPATRLLKCLEMQGPRLVPTASLSWVGAMPPCQRVRVLLSCSSQSERYTAPHPSSLPTWTMRSYALLSMIVSPTRQPSDPSTSPSHATGSPSVARRASAM